MASDHQSSDRRERSGALFGEHWKGKRCGAKGKRSGLPCESPAMENGRCYMHGGASTGPRTAEGKARIARAATKHGRYAAGSSYAINRYISRQFPRYRQS